VAALTQQLLDEAIPTEYMIQWGSTKSNPNRNAPVAANVDEIHEVRCCSDTAISGFVKTAPSHVLQWGSSHRGTNSKMAPDTQVNEVRYNSTILHFLLDLRAFFV
jgi:hypothetical protein